MSTVADAVVIGGGIAGVSAAYELAADRRVILVEQEAQLAHHTTGRSAAVFLESLGPRAVRALTTASRADYAAAPTALGTPPLLHSRAALWLAPPDQLDRLRAMHAEQPELVALDTAGTLEVCPVIRGEEASASLMEPNASDIDVMGLHQGYVRGFAARQGQIRKVWKAVDLVRAGRWWTVVADGDSIGCADVVLAAGAWCDKLAARAGARPVGLRPLRRTIAICPPSVPTEPHWPLVGDVDHTYYWRVEGPNILCSPADETLTVPCDARPDEVDVAVALDRVNTAAALGLRSVVATWAGLRTFAPDRVPVAGADPQVAGLWWLAGQGGYGIQTAPAMARSLASLMRSQGLPADVRALGVTDQDLSPGRFFPRSEGD